MLQGFGMACAFAALAYAFQEGFTSPVRTQWKGDALSIVAACLWGGTTLVIRATRLSTASAEKTLFYQLAVGSAILWIASRFAHEAWPIDGLPAWDGRRSASSR